jgi:hypothetical protein
LKALLKSGREIDFKHDNHLKYFKMVCQFEPQSAHEIFRTSRSIQVDEALPICHQFRVIDASVSISTMLGNFETAVP